MEPHTQCTVYWINWWWQEVVILEWHVNHFGMVILTFGFGHSLSHRYELSAQTRGIIRGPYHPTSSVLNIWVHTVGCWKIQEFVSYTLNFACFSIKKDWFVIYQRKFGYFVPNASENCVLKQISCLHISHWEHCQIQIQRRGLGDWCSVK